VQIANKANHTVELGNAAALGLGGTGPVEMRQVNSRSVVDGVAAPPSLSLPGYSVTILSTAQKRNGDGPRTPSCQSSP